MVPDRVWDVLVVGSGLAGLAAALEVRAAGLKVAVLEKMPGLGGNSIISDGWLNAPGCSTQLKAGVTDDNSELFLRDILKAGAGRADPVLAGLLAGEAGSLEDYLSGFGVHFRSTVGYDGGHSRPRSLIPEKGGAGIYRPMRKHYLQRGGIFLPRHRVDEIVFDQTGEVQGLVVREGFRFDYSAEDNDHRLAEGESFFHRVKRGVVMAAGGYGRDRKFWCLFDPRRPEDSFESTNQPGATAGALMVLMKAGAAVLHLADLQYGPWCSPDEKGFGRAPSLAIAMQQYGLAVDPASGRRFMDESADRGRRTEALFSLKDKDGRMRHAVLVAGRDMPGLLADRSILERPLKHKVARVFESLSGLCEHYGLPRAVFEKEIVRYNNMVEAGLDEDFGRDLSVSGGVMVKGPPYYALRLTAKAHFCQGGVKIDANCRVLSAATLAPIPGLYAAGEIVGGVHGRSRLGNNAISEALVFGRRAGREISSRA